MTVEDWNKAEILRSKGYTVEMHEFLPTKLGGMTPIKRSVLIAYKGDKPELKPQSLMWQGKHELALDKVFDNLIINGE